MKETVKLVGMLLMVAAVWNGVVLLKKRSETRHNEKCARSIQCLDRKAQTESERTGKPVTSRSGKVFLHGVLCDGDCSRIASGYQFAEHVGLTNKEGCDSQDRQHRSGCMAYYAELMDARYDHGESVDPR